jgi:hypothetical protein
MRPGERFLGLAVVASMLQRRVLGRGECCDHGAETRWRRAVEAWDEAERGAGNRMAERARDGLRAGRAAVAHHLSPGRPERPERLARGSRIPPSPSAEPLVHSRCADGPWRECRADHAQTHGRALSKRWLQRVGRVRRCLPRNVRHGPAQGAIRARRLRGRTSRLHARRTLRARL